VVTLLARLHPQSLVGVRLNRLGNPPVLGPDSSLAQEEGAWPAG
jgi:hypothetical protein